MNVVELIMPILGVISIPLLFDFFKFIQRRVDSYYQEIKDNLRKAHWEGFHIQQVFFRNKYRGWIRGSAEAAIELKTEKTLRENLLWDLLNEVAKSIEVTENRVKIELQTSKEGIYNAVREIENLSNKDYGSRRQIFSGEPVSFKDYYDFLRDSNDKIIKYGATNDFGLTHLHVLVGQSGSLRKHILSKLLYIDKWVWAKISKRAHMAIGPQVQEVNTSNTESHTIFEKLNIKLYNFYKNVTQRDMEYPPYAKKRPIELQRIVPQIKAGNFTERNPGGKNWKVPTELYIDGGIIFSSEREVSKQEFLWRLTDYSFDSSGRKITLKNAEQVSSLLDWVYQSHPEEVDRATDSELPEVEKGFETLRYESVCSVVRDKLENRCEGKLPPLEPLSYSKNLYDWEIEIPETLEATIHDPDKGVTTVQLRNPEMIEHSYKSPYTFIAYYMDDKGTFAYLIDFKSGWTLTAKLTEEHLDLLSYERDEILPESEYKEITRGGEQSK